MGKAVDLHILSFIIHLNYSSQFVVHGKWHRHVDHTFDNNENCWETSLYCRCTIAICHQHTIFEISINSFLGVECWRSDSLYEFSLDFVFIFNSVSHVFSFRYSGWMRRNQRMIALPINYNFNKRK